MPSKGAASSGALSPRDATEDLYHSGLHHLFEPTQLVFIKNVQGGLLVSFAGLLAFIVSTGCPGLKEDNPGLTRLLQGLTFPVGLVIVYFVGAELYTGYPMWFAMAALQKKGRPLDYVKGFVVSWIGNFIGALFVAYVFSYWTQTLSEEPYRSGVIQMVKEDIVEHEWHVIFLKAIACGYLVTLAMFFGTQNHDGMSKALGLHLPFFISTAARFPHTVEYMYVVMTGMLLGAPLSVGDFIWKCLLPITLGNAIGGAGFTGAYNWWVYMKCEDRVPKDRLGEFGRLQDGDDEGS